MKSQLTFSYLRSMICSWSYCTWFISISYLKAKNQRILYLHQYDYLKLYSLQHYSFTLSNWGLWNIARGSHVFFFLFICLLLLFCYCGGNSQLWNTYHLVFIVISLFDWSFELNLDLNNSKTSRTLNNVSLYLMCSVCSDSMAPNKKKAHTNKM